MQNQTLDPRNENDLAILELTANEIRKKCIEVSFRSKIPHLGSCLSCIEILTLLYWSVMKIDPDEPLNSDRDKFILSKGHAAPVHLQILARKGFFDEKLIETFGENGSYFHEHPPKPGKVAGIEAATGSLGHGFSMAVGMAKASKIQNKKNMIYCLLGDGETNEGVIWEAALLAPMLELGNLIAFIDYNKWQATGRSKEIMNIDSFMQKWDAFGWNTFEVNGHNLLDIYEAIQSSRSSQHQKPSMIICNTVKGKGVSFMEDNNNWHYKTPNTEEYNLSIAELETAK